MHQLRGLNNHYRSYIVYADRKLGYGIECVSVLMFLTLTVGGASRILKLLHHIPYPLKP